MAEGKWDVKSALAWLARNGHEVMGMVISLSNGAGCGALGCADFLCKKGYTVIYPSRG